MVHKLSSKSLTPSNIDVSARLDVLRGLPNTNDFSDWFNDKNNRWMKDDKALLRELLKNSNQYDSLKSKLLLYKFKKSTRHINWNAVGAVAAVIGVIVSVIVALKSCLPSSFNSKPTVSPETQTYPTKTVTPVPQKLR